MGHEGFPHVTVRAPVWLRISHPVPCVHTTASMYSSRYRQISTLMGVRSILMETAQEYKGSVSSHI